MTAGIRVYACTSAFIACLLVVHAAQAQQVSDEARAYFQNGVELLQDSPPNYEDAYRQFKLAYEKSGRSWKVLGNLGLCALKLERDGEALAFYEEYLKQGGNAVSADERAAIERELLLIRSNLAILNLSSDSTNLTITTRREGSAAPRQVYEMPSNELTLGVRAGTYLVEASQAGERATWEVVVTPGQTVEHMFAFQESTPAVPPVAPATAPAPPGPTTTPAPPPPMAERSNREQFRLPGYVAAGVGGAALLSGVVTGLMARGKEDSAREQCIDKVCRESAESDFDSAKSLATLTNVLVIGGGVIAAAGVGLIVYSSTGSESEPAKTLQLSPIAARGGGGLWATGTF